MKDYLKQIQRKSLNKKVFKKLTFYSIPVVLLSLLIGSVFVFITFSVYIETKLITPLPFTLPQPVMYPEVQNAGISAISAQAAIVIDNTSKTVLFSKNPDLRFSPASTTKIMTAIIGLGTYKLTDVLVLKTIDPEGVHVGFFVGEKMTFENLLYAMLLPSSNDAALAIAQNYPQGQDGFIALMNEKAKVLHLNNTHFADPVGITDDETYTTVSDLSKLASFAIENPMFAKVVATKSKTISDTSSTQFFVKNINQLLGDYGVDGIKTGYTEGAKEVLTTSVVRNNHKFIIVVMKSDDRFADTRTLINTIVNNTTFEPIHL